MTGLIYREECYKIMGCCFDVYNEIGPGHREKTYQNSLIKVLTKKGYSTKKEVFIPIKLKGETVDKNFADIVVNNKIAIELKTRDRFYKRDIDQLFSYLKAKSYKLGLIVNFTSDGAKYKRVVNING